VNIAINHAIIPATPAEIQKFFNVEAILSSSLLSVLLFSFFFSNSTFNFFCFSIHSNIASSHFKSNKLCIVLVFVLSKLVILLYNFSIQDQSFSKSLIHESMDDLIVLYFIFNSQSFLHDLIS